MSLTHSRAWRPARRLPTRWCGTSALLLIPGRIQFLFDLSSPPSDS